MAKFQDFPLIKSLQKTLSEKSFKKPTEIQSRTIPVFLEGQSLVGIAETGSGKTLSYVLPILHILKTREDEGDSVNEERTPRALVIVPARELGEQVAKVFKTFTHETRLRVRSVLGGTKLQAAKENVSGEFEILVATPGRLVQMLERKQISLRECGILVFDEIDQLVDPGFLADAVTIMNSSARKSDRQIALFSATVPPAVEGLLSELVPGASVYRTQGANRVVPTLKTKNVEVPNGKRFPVLEKLAAEENEGGTLIFTNTREQCDELAKDMEKHGMDVAIYRGEMDKVERRTNLKAFREGVIKFLISTDLASRGLDVEHVGRVINYHMPKHLENYLHRVGRTARAGRSGLVVNFVTERDSEIMQKVQSVRAKGT